MSGGGGKQTTVQKSDPPEYLQPFLTDIAQTSFRNSQAPPAFFPGQTFLGPTGGQLDAFGQQFDYADSVFGGQQAPKFGDATGALQQNLTGSTGLGQFAGAVSPLATQSLQQGFGSGAPQFNPSQFTPSLQNAGGFNTSQAFNRALTGTPDYAGLQGSINAANAPILRQFNEDILPQLNQKAAFLGNPTGGIKAVNRILPQLGAQMQENALRATEGERQRALGEQLGAAQYLTGAGQQAFGLGLQGASQNAGIQSDFRGQALGLGQLAGGFQSQLAGNQLQAAGQFPQLAQAGMVPGQLSAQFADFGRQFQDQALQDQIQRFNYYQNLPNQSLQNYSGIVNGFAGIGGVQSGQVPGGNPAGGALGGALAGASAGSFAGPYGALIGGAIGGIGGYFGSR